MLDFFASCGSAAARTALANHDLAAFQAVLAKAYAPATRVLSAPTSFSQLLVNDVQSVECERWHDGKVVLLGDAAHAMAPNLGQGANSALVDVAVLVDELRRASSLNGALRAYDARWRRVVRTVAQMSARLGRISAITNLVGRFFRDRVLMTVAGILASPTTNDVVLQEPAAALLAVGRAQVSSRATSAHIVPS